jgi:restriction system protein
MPNYELSKSKKLAAKVIYAALKALKENGGELSGREVIEKVGQNVQLDDWAKERYEKTGNIRWQSTLQFFSIDCVKAGFLVKKKGRWYLTPEGEEALKLGEYGLLDAASEAYKKWKREKELSDENEVENETLSLNTEKEQEDTIDEIEQIALDGIKAHIKSKNPYEFQDIIAALLRAMGYYTPFVAPKGKDGGIDIIAYRDPLGTVSPRIKVQVKHREQPASVHEIRQLMGLLQRNGDVGIFISSGGFTSDAKTTARTSHVHVELIDLSRFIELWQEFYHKLSDEDKKILPLTPIYFYSPKI